MESTVTEKKLLFNANAMEAAMSDVAERIVSEFSKEALNELAFIGIQKRGIPFMERLVKLLWERTGTSGETGTIDITMYRDDIGMRKKLPIIHETNIPFDINDRTIILVDDILQTGRTIRAALDALTHFGRPSLIRLAALADRGLREFPIRADYTGIICDVPKNKKLKVSWTEYGEEDGIYEMERKI
jgi:pyrimidine operon attenuation protein/uracil phosphoribosyltransferase